ncbi:hypothetical protein [Streptomyces chilikensis]|uniref:hypothetical protein n=1 Tax=Streptomyces chilikensis TaxID=1194079 RepID=UPI000A87F12C|nr:hypothetical protein [Streptomyces chilikensis]
MPAEHALRFRHRAVRGDLDAFALVNAGPDIPVRITSLRTTSGSTPSGQPPAFAFDLHLGPVRQHANA